jgi:prepilin-type N-terminal cleavage/methylation domain-containing protein
MLTRLRSVRSSDRGMTLAELLVGMSLLLTVATLTTMYFVSQNTQANRTLNGSFATSTGRAALTTVATDLRLADTPTAEPGYATGRFVTATATQVVFYSNISANRSGSLDRSPPTKIDIHVSGTKLVEQDYRPINNYTTYPQNYDSSYSSNYPSTPNTTTVLIPSLSNTSSVFSYCAQATSTTSCPAITATDLGTIASVGVQLTVFDQTGTYTQTFQTSITITGATT